MNIRQLGRIIGNPVGVDAFVAVLPAILEADIVIKHSFDPAIEPQPVAQAVKHGEGNFVLPIGHVQHMIIRDFSADYAGTFTFCHQEGQIVIGIIIQTLFTDKSGAVIRQAFQCLVHGLLEQISPDLL